MQNPTIAESIPGAVSHWTEAADPGTPGPGPALEQNTTRWALAMSHLLLVYGVGAGVGRGERYLDFGLFPIRNQFCS